VGSPREVIRTTIVRKPAPRIMTPRSNPLPNRDRPHRRPPTAAVPAEVLYAQRMTAWLDRLYPRRIRAAAARRPPRSTSAGLRSRARQLSDGPRPDTTAGGPRSTTFSRRRRRADPAAISAYDDATIARVRSLLRKERLKSDPETQALEDVACLVFPRELLRGILHRSMRRRR